METGQTLHGVTPWINATVPGGVHIDLWKAGYIDYPYFGQNSLKCEWVEQRWWMYRTSFSNFINEVDLKQEEVTIIFKGLDYEVLIYLNDELIGEHKGMYEPKEINLTGKIKDQNKLVVIFKNVPNEMGQIGYTSMTSTQKSRFNYKWDFSTRLVNIGFWQDVILHIKQKVEIKDLYIYTNYSGNQGSISISGLIEDNRKQNKEDLFVEVIINEPTNKNLTDIKLIKKFTNINNNTNNICVKERFKITTEFSKTLYIKEPKLWYPNGSGEQPLYEVMIFIYENNDLLYECKSQIGIRSLKYTHNELEHKNALPYTVMINDKKVYIKGVNITPLDHVYGNVIKEQYEYMVTAMINLGVNLVRVWGGGLIEKEEFYNLCDENGIMIWQEFIQSSSGIDNKPCEDENFLSLLYKNSVSAVKEKRNHTSLTIWSGGNELMEKANTPSSYSNKNIAMLKQIVATFDRQRIFFPTSASGPTEFITKEKGISHDVHGGWRYEGNPQHYKLYSQSDNLFHSEFGVDGTSSLKSLKKFLPMDSLHPTPMSGDINWQHHGEWWGTYFRDCELFGEIEKTFENLNLFTKCSQYIQSEGLRFIIEADRIRAYQNSGTIIWQLNEPWPNASCTNLIDYYGETKSAYYQVKRVYNNKHISMKYKKLNYKPNEEIKEKVYISNLDEAFLCNVEIIIRNSLGEILLKEFLSEQVNQNKSTCIGELKFKAPTNCEIFFITLLLKSDTKILDENTYLFSCLEKEILKPVRYLFSEIRIIKETTKYLENNRILKTVTLKNLGKEVAIDVGLELKQDNYYLIGDDNYIILFPNEEKELNFILIPKKSGAFLDIENYNDNSEEPNFKITLLGNEKNKSI